MARYNITRVYPYRWFTPVAILGGIIATGLVSFLNIAASGYELIAISSTNPNATESNSVWYQNWPDWLASTKAKCGASSLPLQTGLYTNNTAFFYTVTSAWNYTQDGEKASFGSLVYFNNALQSCNISTLRFDMMTKDQNAYEAGLSPVGTTVTADVTCRVDRSHEDGGQIFVELMTAYDLILPVGQPSSFLNTNATNKASLYWGLSVARLYWEELVKKYYEDNLHRDTPYYKAQFNLDRPDSWNSTGHGETSVDFLRVRSCWLTPLNLTGIKEFDIHCEHQSISLLAQQSGTGKPPPGVWDPLSVLAKAFWFTVLADLGQNDPAMPNMLASPEKLEWLTQNMTQINETLTESYYRWGLSKSLSLSPYLAQDDGDGQLHVRPAVLSTNYICQVPRRKSAASLIVAVVVADYALLQILWLIFVLAVDYFFLSKQEDSDYCEGCAKSIAAGTPLRNFEPQSPSGGSIELQGRKATSLDGDGSQAEASLLPKGPRITTLEA